MKTTETSPLSLSPNNDQWDQLRYKGVIIDFEGNGGSACVMDIRSCNSGCGEAREALLALQKYHANIMTNSVTEDSAEAIGFWQKMLDEGVVTKACLTNGVHLEATPIASNSNAGYDSPSP